MKTINEIKNDVALEHGYAGYLDVFEFAYALCDEVAKRYAKSVAEDLRERIAEEAKTKSGATFSHRNGRLEKEIIIVVDKDSIRNVEIILK